MTDDKPDGLISFLYWIMHDDLTRRRFHDLPDTVMTEFNLKEEIQSGIRTVNANYPNDKASSEAAILFDGHLLGPFLEIWAADITSSQSPPAQASGWVSFMYYARYDRKINESFRRDPKKVMDSFALQREAGDLIDKINQSGGNGDQAKAAAKSLFKEYVVTEILPQDMKPVFW